MSKKKSIKKKSVFIPFITVFLVAFFALVVFFKWDLLMSVIVGLVLGGVAVVYRTEGISGVLDLVSCSNSKITSGYSNSTKFNTTVAKGQIIAELEKLNNKTVSYGEASANAKFYNTNDISEGAVIAALKTANERKKYD